MTGILLRRALRRAAALLVIAMTGIEGQSNAPQPFGTIVASSDTTNYQGAVLSPDGRWIAFNGIAVQSTSGGKIISLTQPRMNGSRPVWFPSGDQIAFRDEPGILRLSFDRATGHAVGVPKRVTFEPGGAFDVSPDGRRIAYATLSAANGRVQLKLVPSNGGIARTLVDDSVQINFPRFSKDGRFVYYNRVSTLMRVPASGGVAARILGPAGVPVFYEPQRDLALVRLDARLAAMVKLNGDTVAAVPIKGSIPPGTGVVMQLSPDGRSLAALEVKEKAELTLVTADDAPPRVLASAGYDEPLFWSPDGARIFTWSNQNGTRDVVMTDAKSGARTVALSNAEALKLPKAPLPGAHNLAVSSDGRSLAYTQLDAGQQNRLVVRDLASGTTREVARGQDLRGLTGHGSSTGFQEFIYVAPNGAMRDVHGVTADGKHRLIATVPSAASAIAVRGDRVAFATAAGESASIFTVRGASASPTRLLTFPGRVHSDEAFSWSPDGRTLAFITLLGGGQHSVYRATFVDVDDTGVARGAPRSVTIEEGWRLNWLPDGSGVVFLGMDPTGNVTTMWRVSRSADAPAVSLTRSIRDPFWTYALSPDGRTLALPVEHAAGSVVWRIDLDSAMAAYRRRPRSTPRP